MSWRAALSRRTGWGLSLLVLVAALGLALRASADQVAVPIQLQVDLLDKVASYDKNFLSRAGERVRVVVVAKGGNDDSAYVASQAQKAIAGKSRIAGLPVESSVLTFTDAASLANLCRTRRIAIVYLASGFGDADIEHIARGLDGVSVLTVGAVAKFVPKGIVLGFDLVGGKPKLLVHLEQAKRQHVELSAQVLKLMRIYP